MTDNSPVRFALNHMAAPRLPLRDFLTLATDLGIREVEIRNDIAGNAILDGTSPGTLRSAASEAGVAVISINALQRFNEWTPERRAQAIELTDYAHACGAAAIVLVPVNDGSGRADGERQRNLRAALSGLQPILAARGLCGLVEPLGFGICSLRSKREAAEAIADTQGAETFRLVHDTFHHHLAGEPALFADLTGLVHISGVEDASVAVDDLRDADRVLVDRTDLIDNVGQMRALIRDGYAGAFSFEPFADAVCNAPSPEAALRASRDFVRASLA